jgi:hypothetical protein
MTRKRSMTRKRRMTRKKSEKKAEKYLLSTVCWILRSRGSLRMAGIRIYFW